LNTITATSEGSSSGKETRMQSANPKVGIILLNWNSWQDTIGCVQSVRKLRYPNYRLYIVDNASSDGSEHHLRQFDSSLTIIQSGANLGWAGGNNVGIRAALADGCRHVYLLNSDARVEEDTLSTLIDSASLTGAAALGSMVVSESDSQWVEFAGSVIDARTHHPRHVYCERAKFAENSKPAPTAAVKGCAMLLTGEGLDAVGLLPEDYFLNYEETDWCYRAVARGLVNYFVPESVVHHRGAASFGGIQSPLYRYFITRNRLLFAHRCLDPQGRRFAWRITFWEFKNVLFLRAGSKRIPLRHRLLMARAVWLGLRDYCLARLGDCPASVRAINRRYVADLKRA
jgi:hypothetical protein